MQEIEVFVLVDQEGNFECADTEDAAAERYGELGNSNTTGLRLFKLKLTVPLPTAIEVEGVVTNTEGTPVLTVK
ncbi:MAG: hypothetical protein C0467_31475 [Planctomycetaceae bacterium]|nr:hypothetical protein [Planctomycetaceae bacterium]